jgi:hypothetical protein
MTTSENRAAPVPRWLALAGIGRTKGYQLLDTGEVDSIKVGRRRLVLLESWDAYVTRQLEAERSRRDAAGGRGSGQ